ncbi:MAG TPA: hypothetical protein VNZ47_07625 [Candidatus Dormibacteraeota bacterium]|jgi:hypothetical protein|nr:hypothetical protein [Candidatus Dormibacteraeota bacterium]
MHLRTLVPLFTAVIILGAPANLKAVQASAAQSNATPTTAPAGGSQSEDPTKKLGAFLGKWETEGAFTSGPKTSTSLECRWSPQGSYLVCDQLVKMATAGDHRQFTVYSYDGKSGNYSYTTLSDPGAKPSTGGITIKGNLWTYDSSFTANGKTTLFRTTNEFTDAKTEVFKVASSEDNGAHWKTVLEGTAHKIAD